MVHIENKMPAIFLSWNEQIVGVFYGWGTFSFNIRHNATSTPNWMPQSAGWEFRCYNQVITKLRNQCHESGNSRQAAVKRYSSLADLIWKGKHNIGFYIVVSNMK